MSSLNIESTLVRFLMSISKDEQMTESARILLAQHPNFEPYAGFQRIDKYAKGGLDSNAILNFLKDNGHFETEENINLLIYQYDLDKDEKLSYKEFLEIILPNSDQSLRSKVVQRETFLVNPNKPLDKALENGLCLIFNTEITQLAQCEKYRKLLVNRKDFDIVRIFQAIDCKGKNVIDFWNLECYLKKRGAGAKPGDVPAIIKRMDKDLDCEVSFREFRDFLIRKDTNSTVSSPRSQEFITPQKISTMQSQSAIQPQSVPPLDFKTPTKVEISKKQQFLTTPGRKQEFSVKMPENSENLDISITSKVLYLLKKDAEFGEELEKLLQIIALKKDFNIPSFLASFEKNEDGIIFPTQFINSLKNNLKLEITKENGYEIFKIIDKDFDDKISIFELSELFLSKMPEYKEFVLKRDKNIHKFTEETVNLLKEILLKYLEIQYKLQNIKETFNDKTGIMLISSFKDLDKTNKGFLNKNDVFFKNIAKKPHKIVSRNF